MVKIAEIIVESKITKSHKLKRLLDKHGCLTVFKGEWKQEANILDIDNYNHDVDFDLAMSFVKNKKEYRDLEQYRRPNFWAIISKNQRPVEEAKNSQSIITKPHKLKRLLDKGQILVIHKKLVGPDWGGTGAWISVDDVDSFTETPVDYDLAMEFANNKIDYRNTTSDRANYLSIVSRRSQRHEYDLDEARNYQSKIITKPHKLKRILRKEGSLLSIVRDRSSTKIYPAPWTRTGAWTDSRHPGSEGPYSVDYDLAMEFANDTKNYLNISDRENADYLNIISRNQHPVEEARNQKSPRRMRHKDQSDKRAAQQAGKKKENVWLTDPIVKAWPEFHRTRPSESSVSSRKIAKFIKFKLHHYITNKNIKAGFGGGDKFLNNGAWQGHRFSKVLVGGNKGSNFSMLYKWDKGILYLVAFIKHQQSDAGRAFMDYANKIINAEESQKAASKLFTL